MFPWFGSEGDENCIVKIEQTCDECNNVASIKDTIRRHKNSVREGIN